MVSDIDEAEYRQKIADLETRVAFQEQSIDDLSQSLYQLEQQYQRLLLQVESIAEKARDLSARMPEADPADEPPPPHY